MKPLGQILKQLPRKEMEQILKHEIFVVLGNDEISGVEILRRFNTNTCSELRFSDILPILCEMTKNKLIHRWQIVKKNGIPAFVYATHPKPI